MKTYRPARELLAEVKRVLAGKPSFHGSPLNDVIEVLCEGRHYSWMGIYLAVQKNDPEQSLQAGAGAPPFTRAECLSKILVKMKIASREVGVIAVESKKENAFGKDDRVLLKTLASMLARFFAGPGKYLVRKARQAPATPEGVLSQSAKLPQKQIKAAVAGEK